MPILLLTGGSSGIGRATAELFAQRGYRVYEMSRHDRGGEGVIHLTGDVTSADDCRRVVHQVLAEAGQIDVLICNAGMGISGAIEFTTSEAMHQQMEVNFFGVVYMVQAVLPFMRQRHQGRILLVGSIASHFSIPFQSFYSASKAALNDFALALRTEVAPWSITVGCLLPGDVKTAFTAQRQKEQAGADIYPHMSRSVSTMEHDEQYGQSPIRIAQALYRMAHSRFLPVYTYVGWGYHLLALLYKLLPATLVNWVVGRLY